MTFDLDRQTLNDLSIFQSGNNQESVFNLLCNTTTTSGGKDALTDIFNKPLTDAKQLKDRIALFEYFFQAETPIIFNKQVYDFAEYYFRKYYDPQSSTLVGRVIDGLFDSLKKSNEYYIIGQGVDSLLRILTSLWHYADALPDALPKLMAEYRLAIQTSFSDENTTWLKQLAAKEKLNSVELSRADHFFKLTAKDQTRAMLDVAYRLEVYQSVAARAEALQFSLPVIADGEGSHLVLEGLFHPFIENARRNDINFNPDKNICFVTGANMAGKSSLLKSIGICVYLSQLGFPVPAAKMETSLFNGMITSINLADDIEHGQSHFYKEVLRVKQVAQKLNQSKNVLVIFDELFRGTNVKDAYDASLAIISAFAKLRNSFFVVSTHIVEVAHELATTENIEFRYMETVFEGEKPVYSYQLKNGITKERLGMWIVKNEGILEIIERAITDRP